jgi:hypothetical protein
MPYGEEDKIAIGDVPRIVEGIPLAGAVNDPFLVTETSYGCVETLWTAPLNEHVRKI